jgi:uncharacterized protein
MMEEVKTNKKYWFYAGIIIIVLFFILAGGCNEKYGRNSVGDNQNVVTISGHGEVQAVPDIANISFTIKKEAKTVKDAQTQVAIIEGKVLDSLKANNVLEKDIKTVNVSFNPKYEYNTGVCTMYSCPNRNVLVGYEAYENISVKIKEIDNTGKVIQDLGILGVTDLSGPDFTVDNEDGLKAQAQKLAIDDAKAKAKILAKNLGVHLNKITSFNESGNYPMPMYASAKMDSVSSAGSAPAVLPTGQNTISSDVTITYEIR